MREVGMAKIGRDSIPVENLKCFYLVPLEILSSLRSLSVGDVRIPLFIDFDFLCKSPDVPVPLDRPAIRPFTSQYC